MSNEVTRKSLDCQKLEATKDEMIKWLQERKDIPDDAYLQLGFDGDSRKFKLWFSWSEKGVPAAFGDDFVDFDSFTSEETIREVFELSV